MGDGMPNYECPDCGGGFEKPYVNEQSPHPPACPWCAKAFAFDGMYTE